MQTHPKIKVDQIQPSCQDFQLHFQISEIVSKDNKQLTCRVVDDTGIVNACFDKFVNKLQKGGVYLMTHLKCSIVDKKIRIQNTDQTVISKQPDIIGFKDRANDISKKIYETGDSKTQVKQTTSLGATPSQPTPAISTASSLSVTPGVIKQVSPRKYESLIPFTKQQAIEQIRIQKQFLESRFKPHNNKQHKQYKPKQEKGKQRQIQKQKGYKQAQKKPHIKNYKDDHKIEYKQKNERNQYNKYKTKQQKQYEQKPGYKPKHQYQEKTQKTKSLFYKQKSQDTNKRNMQKNKDKQYKNQRFSSNKYKQKQQNKTQKSNQKTQQTQTDKNKEESKVNGKEGQTPTQTQQKNQTEKPAQEKQKENQDKQIVDETAQQKIETPNSKKSEKRQVKSELTNIQNLGSHLGNSVNLKVWTTKNRIKNQKSGEDELLIADASGAVWLRVSKINLQSEDYYEIDNLQVCKQQDKIFLKQDEFTQFRKLQGTISYNLAEVNFKQ